MGLPSEIPATDHDDVMAEGRHLRLSVTRGGWEYASRVGVNGTVAIIARTDAGQIIFVEQYRPPVHARVIEIPAGLAGDTPEFENEALNRAAGRELVEETGFAAERFEHLFTGPSSAGLTDETVSFFLAHGLSRVGVGGGALDEAIDVHLVAEHEVDQWLLARRADGCLIDPKVYTALYFLAKGAGA